MFNYFCFPVTLAAPSETPVLNSNFQEARIKIPKAPCLSKLNILFGL